MSLLWYMGHSPEIEAIQKLASDFEEQFKDVPEQDKEAAWGAVSEFAKGVGNPTVLKSMAPKYNQTAKGVIKAAPAATPAAKAETIKNTLGSQYTRVGQLKGPVINNVQGKAELDVAKNSSSAGNKVAGEIDPDTLEIFADQLVKQAEGNAAEQRAVADVLAEAIPMAARIKRQQEQAAKIQQSQEKTAYYKGGNNNNRPQQEESWADTHPKALAALVAAGVGGAVGGGVALGRHIHNTKLENAAFNANWKSTIDKFNEMGKKVHEAGMANEQAFEKKFEGLGYSEKTVKKLKNMYQEMHNTIRSAGKMNFSTKAEKQKYGKDILDTIQTMKGGPDFPDHLLSELHDQTISSFGFDRRYAPKF